MELRHLRYFCVLAEELHFGKAAARLHISQPPLSRQIEQLETELGFLLFHRPKRMVELTAAGAVFFSRSKTNIQTTRLLAKIRTWLTLEWERSKS
jgi:DNA-binding transcriptional LysR family regulator